MPQCKRCKAEIIFIKTPKRKWIPCDPELKKSSEMKTGDILVHKTFGKVWTCNPDREFEGYVSHFATCPYSKEFKREQKEKIKQEKASEPDWNRTCEICGATPVVSATGMCGPCTFGDASTIGGNW